jgi:GNAT superfamily N-acetyltransferase
VSTSERVDPQDAAAFDAWYDVFQPAVDDEREFAVTWAREELRVAVLDETPYSTRELWAVRDDAGQLAGAMVVDLPMKDNTAVINPRIGVRADARRRGYGAALARTAAELAAQYGRTVVQCQLDVPLAGEDAPETAGQAFVEANGLKPANFEVHRILELPLDEAFLESLAAEAAEHHQGYQLVSWQDHCPDEFVDAYAALQSTFILEAPTGELEVEAEVFDEARIRSVETRSLAQGRHGWITVAVAPDGTLAGNTELYVGEHSPGKAFQWGTLVSPAHRGHRLGLALKARNHRELQRSHSEPLVVHTWNGEQNTPMNGVNAKLGFRPVELAQEWQGRIVADGTAKLVP